MLSNIKINVENYDVMWWNVISMLILKNVIIKNDWKQNIVSGINNADVTAVLYLLCISKLSFKYICEESLKKILRRNLSASV